MQNQFKINQHALTIDNLDLPPSRGMATSAMRESYKNVLCKNNETLFMRQELKRQKKDKKESENYFCDFCILTCIIHRQEQRSSLEIIFIRRFEAILITPFLTRDEIVSDILPSL